MKKTALLIIGVALVVGSAFALASCTSSPQPSAQLPAPPATTLPAHGSAVTTPTEVGTPTVVAKGVKPEDHIKKYYDAYIAGKWEEAYELLPAISKAKEPLESYRQSRASMPITSYSIGVPVESKEGTRSVVRYPVDVNSSGMQFQTTWTFIKQSDGSYIVDSMQTAIGGQ